MLYAATNPYPDIVPNPAKVLIILEELGLPYQSSWVELEDLKKEPFESINPNGRVPGTSFCRSSLGSMTFFPRFC